MVKKWKLVLLNPLIDLIKPILMGVFGQFFDPKINYKILLRQTLHYSDSSQKIDQVSLGWCTLRVNTVEAITVNNYLQHLLK